MRKYYIDDNYLEKIDTQEKAYILGLMYADGCVYKTWAKLDLKSDDQYLLEQIRGCMDNECPIKTYTYQRSQYFKNSNKTYQYTHSMSRLSMRSKKMVLDLIKNGCGYNKTYSLKFPDKDIISNNMIRHFIRGYFDGDGSISYTTRTSSVRDERLHFQITFTGTFEMMTGIREYLNKYVVNFVGYIYKRWKTDVNNYTLTIDGNNVIKQILDWMYKDSAIHLKRKYDKYILLVNEIDKREESLRKVFETRKNPNTNFFNIYYKNKYIGTCNNRRKLVRESEKILGIKINRINIYNCLYKINKEYKGYKFIYAFEDSNIINEYKYVCCGKENLEHRKKVIQLNSKMEIIKIWDSISEACEYLNINSGGISACCKGRQITCKGYMWKYYEDYIA